MTSKAKGAGDRFRQQFLEDFEIQDASDAATLDSCCALLDEIERMEQALERDGYFVTGSADQLIAHPALNSLRQHRQTFERLLARLKEDPDKKESPSQKKARAARTRWAQERGA